MLVRFASFRADLADERLWRGDEPVHLTRKAWGVLRVLLDSHGRLVTKEHLAQTVWNGTHVGDDSLTKVVRELRRALDDDQRAPRFIGTVHGRGYRFVMPLETAAADRPLPAETPAALIGRAQELATIWSWLDDARRGRRRVGFVSGGVGIGKSSLVTAFLDAAQRDDAVTLHVAPGWCVEQYGEAEPFLPVIAALRRAARTPAAAEVVRTAAPSWLSGACGLAAGARTAGEGIATRTGVVRILAEVIEALADQTPLVLVLEDLHWSDPSTLDLVNLLARRTDPARLLVLGTLRYGDVVGTAHRAASLVRELRRNEHAREIALTPWSADDVARYLAVRLGDAPPAGAAQYLFRHAGGNPFFLRALLDDLMARRSLRREQDRWVLHQDPQPALPSGSLAALTPRLERLNDSERLILETASVVGDAFASETIAAALAGESNAGTGLEDVEAVCERFVRHQDVLRAGEPPRPYAFQHALYRQALYQCIAPARRRRLHRSIAESLVEARSVRSPEGAAELAEHFARAGEHARAASFHTEAALAARARFADREVATHLGAALTHLRDCPDSAERDLQELMLLPQHAAATMALSGFGDPAVADACGRALALARRLKIPMAEFLTTAGLLFLNVMRAELDDAAALAHTLEAAAPSLNPGCVAAADAANAVVLFSRGDLRGARHRLETSRGMLPRRTPGFTFDATVWHLALLAMVYAGLGEVRAARATIAESLAAAADGAATDVASAHMLVASIEAQLGNASAVLEHVETALRTGARHDASVILAGAGQLRGWALVALGDSAGARAAYADRGATFLNIGQRFGLPFLAMLRTESALCEGDLVTANAALRVGLEHAQRTGERRLDSELHRLRAECLRRAGKINQAAGALAVALAVAAEQGARLAELRAAIDNVRLQPGGSASAAPVRRLAEVVQSFAPGEALPELAAARNLLLSDSSAA